MKPIKILNLYACLGGNRYKWDEVADIEVTAVELDQELARLYQKRFPNDKVIVADAHKFLLDLKLNDELENFLFVWSSPPCPSHSKMNSFLIDRGIVRYPDMKLYEEILFLKHFFKGKYCVENVIPYYDPLIAPKKRGRHLYWTNFNLPNDLNERKNKNKLVETGSKPNEIFHEIDLSTYKGKQRKDKIACNLVDYEAGRTILETALGIFKDNNKQQIKLF